MDNVNTTRVFRSFFPSFLTSFRFLSRVIHRPSSTLFRVSRCENEIRISWDGHVDVDVDVNVDVNVNVDILDSATIKGILISRRVHAWHEWRHSKMKAALERRRESGEWKTIFL